MAQNDRFKRYLDAGAAFTQITRSRAEAIVKDLVKAGEIQRDQAQEWVDELMERSRKNTEALVSLIRKETAAQLGVLGIATKQDIARLEAKIAKLSSSGTAGRSAAAKTGATKTAAAKKAPAKKAPAKKAAAAKKA
jgi:polyhydroxyalkanoate synthesis regulator phasin